MIFTESNDPTIEEDLNWIVNQIDWSFLKQSTILVTGSTGLIGRNLVNVILLANKIFKLDLRVLAGTRSIRKAESLFGRNISTAELEIIDENLEASSYHESKKINYIIHTSAPTASSYFVEYPVETIDSIFFGIKKVLETGRQKAIKGIIFLSSMEVYGSNYTLEEINEEDFGKLDPMLARSSYSEGKRIGESLCVAYHKEFNVPVKVVRLAQTFGPGVNWEDERVFAQFARKAIQHKPIILHTKGETTRNYCYTADAITGIICVFSKGLNGHAYNLANSSTACSIWDMAIMISERYGLGKPIVELGNSEQGYNPFTKTVLNTKKLESLGWAPSYNMEEMYDRMISSLRYNMTQLSDLN